MIDMDKNLSHMVSDLYLLAYSRDPENEKRTRRYIEGNRFILYRSFHRFNTTSPDELFQLEIRGGRRYPFPPNPLEELNYIRDSVLHTLMFAVPESRRIDPYSIEQIARMLLFMEQLEDTAEMPFHPLKRKKRRNKVQPKVWS